jgi:hypothetical protein
MAEGSGVKPEVGGATSGAGEMASERALAVLGTAMEELAARLRQGASESGRLGEVVERVASGVERGGQYLASGDLQGFADELGAFVRRHPGVSVGLGVGAGFALGRLLGARRTAGGGDAARR